MRAGLLFTGPLIRMGLLFIKLCLYYWAAHVRVAIGSYAAGLAFLQKSYAKEKKGGSEAGCWLCVIISNSPSHDKVAGQSGRHRVETLRWDRLYLGVPADFVLGVSCSGSSRPSCQGISPYFLPAWP